MLKVVEQLVAGSLTTEMVYWCLQDLSIAVKASAEERSLPLINAALDRITESAEESLHTDQKKRQHIIAENITKGKTEV